MTFESITNRGEFFSNHYLDAVISGDLNTLRSSWDALEAKGEPTARARLKSLPSAFFAARAAATEASPGNRPTALHHLNEAVLGALGFPPARDVVELKRNTEHLITIPAATKAETGTGLLLVAIEAGLADSVDDLFDFDEKAVHDVDKQPGQLLAPVMREADKHAVHGAADAVGEIFATDDPPRYILVLGGRIALLAERSKWVEGRYLAVDLDAALERNDTKARGELETIAALFSADAIVPGALEGTAGQSVLDDLVENSHKHAVGVSKDLRNGIRESIEILANEVIFQLDEQAKAGKRKQFSRSNVDARQLTTETLRYLYRLLVLLYAESRPELGILPVDDEAYLEGYSLDRLRELVQVDLLDDKARSGSHLHQSLQLLFELVNDGRHAEGAQQQLDLTALANSDEPGRSVEDYLQFPGLDAALFDRASTELVGSVVIRNEALQQILRKLMLSKGKGKKGTAGFISYAQLGINQLGAVYEGLMAYNGFFAAEDLYEVAKGGDPSDGTWMLPVAKVEAGLADEYPDDVFVTRPDEITGQPTRVRHAKGSFVFRLSGRDRQRSASYYTPEVLTRCVVKHALAELLGLDDYAPEHGSSGIVDAVDLLDLTICEPALGSGAFANEAINQLSAEYLRRRQAELGETLDAERAQRELQRVKAHFALHQTYGVDLNATAIELAEVSLWLNCMYPGLKAPWFGLQLRAGNSLIGCRRATWRVGQLGDRPWAQTKKDKLQPAVDRKLNEPLPLEASDGADREIHHFLLPGHGWAAIADRKEAKELRPDEVKALKEWRKAILAAPKKTDADRLVQLAAGVEAMWAAAAEQIAFIQKRLRRRIDLYGYEPTEPASFSLTRDEARELLRDPNSPLGRLRTLMDAWAGLWFWSLDTGERPPTWGQWLQVAEELIRPDERHGLTGQLDLFDDLAALNEAEAKRRQGQSTVSELRDEHAWLAIAVDSARREGAWHWDLEFAPVFQRGGFDLQVGNPPWVRPSWFDDLVLAEGDPWWGVVEKPGANAIKERRTLALSDLASRAAYLAELSSAEGIGEYLGSPVFRPVLAGVQTNLYMVFMDATWRHLAERGAVGLLHPESHYTDPKARELRASTYRRLARAFLFPESRRWFEDLDGQMTTHSVNVYIPSSLEFMLITNVQGIEAIEGSLGHTGQGELPGIQYPWGGWDTRPHAARLLTVDSSVRSDWARLFDEPGTPAAEARLVRPVTTADLNALSVLASQPVRLADHDYHWTAGWHEKGAKTDGTIRWETAVPGSWDEVILQGPHFSVATPYSKQPNENCKHNQDYSDWDLEVLPERVVPRTNYQRACDRDTYDSRLDHWKGTPSTDAWRVVHRLMTQPGLERSLHAAILPPGPLHVHGAQSTLMNAAEVVAWAGLKASLPLDYLTKTSGTANISDTLLQRFPFPRESAFFPALALRTLRLNCLTADYAPLWESLYDGLWQEDSWTGLTSGRLGLGEIGPRWTMATPLRRDEHRRRALVEIDALTALMLGLTGDQLCAMYRTQFAVLRKYEHKMVFDAEGRKICGHHQSAGYRQAQLQDQAKAGDLPKEWTNLWKLYEQYEDDPSSVDWMGHYIPPFGRADREAEMTQAYNEFKRRYPEA